MTSSSSSANLPIAQVPAFPVTVIAAGANGEDVEIPSGSTNPRSRSTPEQSRPRIPDLPPGLPVHLTQNVVNQQQNNRTTNVRQEIALIEQRLLMLRQMEQNNVLTNLQMQHQQNLTHVNPQHYGNNQQVNAITVNMQDPVTTELAAQAIATASQATQDAQAQTLQAHLLAQQAEQHVQLHANEDRQFAEQVAAQAEHELAARTHQVETRAQAELAALQLRARQAVLEEQQFLQEQALLHRDCLTCEVRDAFRHTEEQVEQEREALRQAQSQPAPLPQGDHPVTPPVKQALFTSPQYASVPPVPPIFGAP